MTDDTSDDRMDRAQRIREMREGSRPDDTPDDSDGDGAAETDGAAGDSEAPPAGETAGGEGEPGPGEAADWFDDADGAGDGAGNGSGVNGAEAADTDSSGDDESPFGDGVPQVPGMDVDDASVDAEVLAEQAGLETDAGGESGAATGGPANGPASSGATAGAATQGVGDGDEAGGAVGMAGARGGAVTGTTAEDETRVLEFALAEERYCLDIEYVEEIVKRDTVTRVPNTPDYVAGVVDLRGQITTILDPKVIFDIDVEGSEELIVVFDPDGFDDQGAIGWLVDDVNQVMPVADSEVNPSPVDQEHVEGVVDRDGEFVIWTTPELAVEDATG
jgi:purine-binding chemotaxis protein CheW